MPRTTTGSGQVEGLASDTNGGTWRQLRVLLLSSLDAIGTYGVTEHLGLALGRPGVTNITVPILMAKGEHLQECFLEMAANRIL